MSNLVVNQMGDFLDLLRFFNATNINDNPELRDGLFEKLYSTPSSFLVAYDYICNSNNYSGICLSDYLSDYILPYKLESSYEMKECWLKCYKQNVGQLVSIISNNIIKFISSGSIVDKKIYLKVRYLDSYDSIEYIASVIAMLDIVKIDCSFFDEFKLRLIEALVIHYCLNYAGYFEVHDDQVKIDTKRFNKALVIYAECKGVLEQTDEIPNLIDEIFLSEIKSLPKYWNGNERYLQKVKDLFDRKISKNAIKLGSGR